MLLVYILALALPQPIWLKTSVQGTYAACVEVAQPLVCVSDLAIARGRDLELSDLIAAGALHAARRRAPARERRTVELAARIAAGEGHESLSPLEAQRVLALFSDVTFYDSGLPEDPRAIGLWSIAMGEPIGDIRLRWQLVQAAASSGRQDLVGRLVADAPVAGSWSDDQRASFASIAAREAYDWRVAEAFLASGGERARGYSIAGVRLEIDQARLHNGYSRDAASRVLADILADNERLPWTEAGPDALKAGDATEELRTLGAALLSRGRASGRSPDDRTTDFGLASWAYEASGDQDMAISAAREGAALTPLAVAERTSGHSNAGSVTPAQAAQMANGFGTWPVRRLYELGLRDEALAVGFLAGRDRYLLELEAGRVPDPAWLTEPRIDYELKLVVPSLQQRRATSEARALLLRMQAVPADWVLADPDELMMLAAIAGEDWQVEAIFEEATRELDDSEDEVQAEWALQLVIARRAADAELSRSDRTDRQTP